MKEAAYDDVNNTVTLYDELDHKTIRYYDGLGRLVKTEVYLTETVKLSETYTYNYLDIIKTATDSGGHTYSYEYDPLGRLRKQFNPDSTFREIQYNDPENIITVFDENDHKKAYHHDWSGNLVWVKEYTNADCYLTQYTYDFVGNLTSFTDANGNTTTYEYNMFGATQVTYPDSTSETCSYDAVGNVVQKTGPNGVILFMYNAIYQLTEVLYPDQSTSFEYDENGNRIVMTDSEGQTHYVYDSRNRLSSETRTVGNESFTVGYQYDAASRLISLMYPDQSVITYEYDNLNRVTAIPGYAEFTYQDSLLTSVAYTNGTVTSYQYDSRTRPQTFHTQKNGTDLLLLDYAYDAAGNITQLDYNRLNNGQWVQSTEVFTYDYLDRLVSAQGEYGLILYSYDAVGNRLSQNEVTFTYNAMSEVLSSSEGTLFTYDENGNTRTKYDGTHTWSYSYDMRNLLVQVEKNLKVIAHYHYDGDGQRIEKTEWIESSQEYQTTLYVYSGSNVVYEKNVTTNLEATYVYGPLGRIAKTVSGLKDYYHTDHLGSTRLVTDESGEVVSEVEYEPFGNPAGDQEGFLFTGKERDETGLYYYGARYYDCETGRFLTRDPVAGKMHIPQSLNRYTYCLNNPLKYVDPVGLSEEILSEEGLDTSVTDSISFDWESFFSKLIRVLQMFGINVAKFLREYITRYLTKLLTLIVQSYGLGLLDETANFILALMSFLEAVVAVCGEILGITGAFICIEGMALAGLGGQGGICYVFHPDLGWAMYYYLGYLMGGGETAGLSIIAGFWTWHYSSNREFTFNDWKHWFFNIEGTGGAIINASGVYFTDYYTPPRITGWGVGIGGGIGVGAGFGRSYFSRAPDWMIPYYLRGIVVPQGA